MGQQVGKMPQSFMAHRRICNTFITSLPCKAAARLISRMQAGGQRERRAGKETEIQRVMETEGTLDSLTQTIHRHRGKCRTLCFILKLIKTTWIKS